MFKSRKIVAVGNIILAICLIAGLYYNANATLPDAAHYGQNTDNNSNYFIEKPVLFCNVLHSEQLISIFSGVASLLQINHTRETIYKENAQAGLFETNSLRYALLSITDFKERKSTVVIFPFHCFW